MKNIIKLAIMTFAVVMAVASCAPKEYDDYDLGTNITFTEGDVSFTLTKCLDCEAINPKKYTKDFTYILSLDVNTKGIYSFEVNYGDDAGTIRKVPVDTFDYVVYAGTYTATCAIYLPDGNILMKSQAITFADDNEKIYSDDPESFLFALTGGKDNLEGKTWTLGPWTAMRNPDNRNDAWWRFDKDGDGIMNLAMQNDEMTFISNSLQLNGRYVYENNGDTFCNESLENEFADGESDSFVTLLYTPPTDATWEITEEDGKTYLTLHKGFISYPIEPSDLDETKYEVYSYSPTSIKLIYASGWNAWSFELKCEPPLTGEGSKTWVIDGYNKHVAEAKAKSGLNIKGFMGLGPNYSQEWWGAEPGDKAFEECGWTMYDWKMTFSDDGKLKIETEGEGYGRKAYDGGNFNSTSIDGDDMTFNYDGGNYTYQINNTATPYPKMTLSGNAFLTYYCGTQEYEIVALTSTVLAVVVHNAAEGHDWILVFTPEGEQ